MDQSQVEQVERGFAALWGSSAAANLADGILLAGLPVLATTVTTDPRAVAAVQVVLMGAMALTALPSGVAADRRDRRRVLLGANAIRAAGLAGGLALALAGHAVLAAVYLVAAVAGSTEILADATAETAVPDLVGPSRIGRAHARLMGTQQVLNDGVGAPLGGFLAAGGVGLALAIPAALYALAAGLVGRLVLPPRPTLPRHDRPTALADIGEGIHALRCDPVLSRMAAASAVINLANSAFFAVAVLLVIGPVGLPRSAYGVVLLSLAVGGVVGSVLVGPLTRVIGARAVLCLGPVATGLGYGLACAVPHPVVVVVGLTAVAASGTAWNVISRVIRQQRVAPALLGRVGAAVRLLALCAAPLGGVIGGVVAEAAEVQAVGWVTTAGAVASLALLWPVDPIRPSTA